MANDLPENVSKKNVRVTRKTGQMYEGDVIADSREIDLPLADAAKKGVLVRWPDGSDGCHTEMYLPESAISSIDVFGDAIHGYI